MRPLAIAAATIMGATTFVAWCAARAGSRPTPQPPQPQDSGRSVNP